MNETWKAILESKRRERDRLRDLPFSEKVALLEKLRDRAIAASGSSLYRAHEPQAGRAGLLREAAPKTWP